MIRKRTIIIVITILLLLAGSLSYLQWGRQMDVSSSSGSGSDNHYELRASVYKNQKGAESGNSAFSFSYRQENQIDGTYNIVDNPEKFTLEMD